MRRKIYLLLSIPTTSITLSGEVEEWRFLNCLHSRQDSAHLGDRSVYHFTPWGRHAVGYLVLILTIFGEGEQLTTTPYRDVFANQTHLSVIQSNIKAKLSPAHIFWCSNFLFTVTLNTNNEFLIFLIFQPLIWMVRYHKKTNMLICYLVELMLWMVCC